MATYKVLYWRDIPSQIKADDGDDEVTLPMPPKFMEQIDRVAMASGLQDTDSYLEQWNWSEEQEREGSANEVAQAVKAELESQSSW